MSTLPGWFNDSAYMQNKAKQAGLTVSATKSAFEEAGFYGEDGDFSHFINHGQWEDVSPITTFDPEYYYKSKAATFYDVDISQVTTTQKLFIEDAIHGAGMNAWSHYQLHGTREGVDASAGFDTSAYMEAKLAQMKNGDPAYTMDQLYAAFENAGLSAVAHYEAHGKAEGLQATAVSSPTAPKPAPSKSVTATLASNNVTFADGVADTFITKFGTGRTHVQSWDLTDITLKQYGSMLISDDTEILLYKYITYMVGDHLFTNRSEKSLSGEALAERVAADGSPLLGWSLSSTDAKLIFTATSVPSGSYYDSILDKLYGAYSYSDPYYNGDYRHIFPTTTVEGVIGTSSTSSFRYSNYSDTIYCDTITGFNPKEDHISLPIEINSLIKGGTLSSLSELLEPIQIDANQAKLFRYGSEYYLLINDADKLFDVNVDVTIHLAGLSSADAASMTADIFV